MFLQVSMVVVELLTSLSLANVAFRTTQLISLGNQLMQSPWPWATKSYDTTLCSFENIKFTQLRDPQKAIAVYAEEMVVSPSVVIGQVVIPLSLLKMCKGDVDYTCVKFSDNQDIHNFDLENLEIRMTRRFIHSEKKLNQFMALWQIAESSILNSLPRLIGETEFDKSESLFCVDSPHLAAVSTNKNQLITQTLLANRGYFYFTSMFTAIGGLMYLWW